MISKLFGCAMALALLAASVSYAAPVSPQTTLTIDNEISDEVLDAIFKEAAVIWNTEKAQLWADYNNGSLIVAQLTEIAYQLDHRTYGGIIVELEDDLL